MVLVRMLVLAASLVLISACAEKSSTPRNSGVEIIDVSFQGHQENRPPYTVSKGQHVQIRVSTTVADELYVHGYEQKADAPAGYPAAVEFVADKTGRFDVEMRRAGVKLFELRVS
ncbi:MAG TPA: hypothetical protein VFU43_19860 [Streptosporangiaceae bacterium]|nr:hypothetical protein [Streptosporangiaceae bacterium]